mgnify:CR=1 FL=1
MGLDQYAYIAAQAGQHAAFYEGAKYDDEANEYVNPHISQPREIAYWRKHPNLHGWMEQLYRARGGKAEIFNGVELELTYDDILKLEEHINNGIVSSLNTRGFFFGDPSDDYYREQDLQFVRIAKAELFCGIPVFYNSSW